MLKLPRPKSGSRGKRRARLSGVVTALEMDGSQLRVAQGETQGGECRITRLENVLLTLPAEEKNDPAAVGKAVAASLAEAKLKGGGPMVMGIPRGQVVLRTLTLPDSGDTSAMASMVYFQVAKDLPFRADEAVIDFRLRRDMSEAAGGAPASPGQAEVLVAAVKREALEFYTKLAEAAGIRLAALGLLSYANVRCLEACKVSETGQTLALVSVRPQESGIDVIGNRTLLFSRNVFIKLYEAGEEPPNEPLFAEDEQPGLPAGEKRSFEQMAAIEVVRTLHSYAGGHATHPVSRVIVSGSTGSEAKIVELLGKRLSIPCSLLETGITLKLPAGAAGLAGGSIAPMGLVIGALDADGLPFDFLNPKKPAVPRNYKKIAAIGIAAALAVGLIAALGSRRYMMNKRTALQTELQTQLTAIEKQTPIFRRLIQQSRVVEGWTTGGRSWLAHYAFLSSILPPAEELYVHSFAVNPNGTLRLMVQAQSGETLARMEKGLRDAGYEVRPVAITPGADRYGYNFRSGVELVIPARLKVDLAKIAAASRPEDDASLDPAARKRGGGG